MGRRFKDMRAPEQEWAAQQAPRLRQMAHAADREAQRQQMTADVYGRRDSDYSDPDRAASAQREADRQRNRRDGLRASADQAEQAVTPPKKRGWFR